MFKTEKRKRDVCLDFSEAIAALEQQQLEACEPIFKALGDYVGGEKLTFAQNVVIQANQLYPVKNGSITLSQEGDTPNTKSLRINIVPWEEYVASFNFERQLNRRFSTPSNSSADDQPLISEPSNTFGGSPSHLNHDIVLPAFPQCGQINGAQKTAISKRYKDIINFPLKRNESNTVKKSDIGTGLGFGALAIFAIGIGIVALTTSGIGLLVVALVILAVVGAVSPALGLGLGKSVDDKENKAELKMHEMHEQNVGNLERQVTLLQNARADSPTNDRQPEVSSPEQEQKKDKPVAQNASQAAEVLVQQREGEPVKKDAGLGAALSQPHVDLNRSSSAVEIEEQVQQDEQVSTTSNNNTPKPGFWASSTKKPRVQSLVEPHNPLVDTSDQQKFTSHSR